MPLETVGAASCGGLALIVPPDALVCSVCWTAHPTPDGRGTAAVQVVVLLALITTQQLLVIRLQGVSSPGAQVQSLWQGAHDLLHNLAGWGLVPEGAELLGSDHMGVVSHHLDEEVQGVLQ